MRCVLEVNVVRLVDLLHLRAISRLKKLARRAPKLGLEDAVALRIGSKTRRDSRRLQCTLALVHETNEPQQPLAGSILDERHAQIAVKVPAKLTRLRSGRARQALAIPLRMLKQ